MALSKEDRQQIGETVELAVTRSQEVMWERIRTHDTEVALLKQDAEQSKKSQIAQGERLGKEETRGAKHTLYWKILWVGLTTFCGFVAWLVSKAM